MPFFERLALSEIVKLFLEADDAGDSKAIVVQYPALLTKEADELLAKLAHSLQKRPGAEELVQDLRLLLKRCRELGIDAAYQARQRSADEERLRDALADFISADTEEELKSALIAYPELQSESADERLAEWEADTSSYGADRIAAMRILLRSSREHGVDAAMAAYTKSKSDLENWEEIFKQFLDTEMPEEQRALIERHPVLLSRQVAAMIDSLINVARQTGSTDFLDSIKRKKRALKTSD